MEILVPAVMNREVSDLENAGTVNLQIRENKKVESDSEGEDDNKKGYYDLIKVSICWPNDAASGKKGKNKKKGKKEQKNKKKGEEDDDEKPVPESKKKDGKKKEEAGKAEEKKPQEEAKLPAEEKKAEVSKGEGKAFKCTTCAEAFFDSKDDFRNHYKSEWHQFNLKQKSEVTCFVSIMALNYAYLEEESCDSRRVRADCLR